MLQTSSYYCIDKQVVATLADEIVSGEKHPMLASFGAERFS